MSNKRSSDVHQSTEAVHDESADIAADSPSLPASLAQGKEALLGMPYEQLVQAVAELMYDDNADVQHATWDALVRARR